MTIGHTGWNMDVFGLRLYCKFTARLRWYLLLRGYKVVCDVWLQTPNTLDDKKERKKDRRREKPKSQHLQWSKPRAETYKDGLRWRPTTHPVKSNNRQRHPKSVIRDHGNTCNTWKTENRLADLQKSVIYVSKYFENFRKEIKEIQSETNQLKAWQWQTTRPTHRNTKRT